ncbi:MAG: ABC transporter permease [Chloroflexota bacterium]
MGAYFIRRILIAIPVLLGITLLAFVVIKSTPGDPLTARMDPETYARMQAHPEQLEAMRRQYGLDQPLPVQYLRWLDGVLHGDLGYAISTGRSIGDEISSRIGPSLLLMVLAALVALAFGLPAGILSAVHQYGKVDYALSAVTVLLISTPTFVLGLIAIYVFGVNLDWLPVGELVTIGKENDLLDRLSHFVLPALILGLVNAALLMRYTRASMVESLGADYITTARSKGLPSRVIVIRHGLRNALIPVITVLAFLMPELIAGAVVTETVFNWPGLGQLSVKAAKAGDPAMMMGVVLIVGIAVLLASILADLGYAIADPRIRYDRGR